MGEVLPYGDNLARTNAWRIALKRYERAAYVHKIGDGRRKPGRRKNG